MKKTLIALMIGSLMGFAAYGQESAQGRGRKTPVMTSSRPARIPVMRRKARWQEVWQKAQRRVSIKPPKRTEKGAEKVKEKTE